MVIGIKPDKIKKYRELHANPWKEVISKIRACSIRNYSIFLTELEAGKYYLFSYFEYTGNDFSKDMAEMGKDDMTVRWWKETDPCQIPCETRKKDEFWMNMTEVFHSD
jgi:L-rhamnose mutarotase